MRFKLLYPEQRVVDGETLIGWARDFIASERSCTCDAGLDHDCLPTCATGAPLPDLDAFEAAEILADAGEVTLGNRGEPI